MEILRHLVYFCWSAFSVFVILGVIGQLYRPKKDKERADVECVLVSVANNKVKNSLFECINHTKEKLRCSLTLVIDEGSELLPELNGNTLIIVPNSYNKDLIGKGRAIHYFIENEVQPDKWYVFIDDDNLILDDRFLYEIPYYDKKGYVAMNPVLIPRKGRSTLTYIMDFIRYFDDLTVFRFFTGLLKRPLLGLHGEYLAVKGKTLKEIGYGNHSITEDFRFASELVRRGYKTWQSASRVSIKSPNSLSDLLKQRGRWYKGILGDFNSCPILMRIIVSLRLIIWTLGIFGSWLLSPLWFLFWSPFYYAIPGGLYYWAVYLFGVGKSRKLYYACLIPIFGILEAGSIWIGLRQKGFVVIDKN